MNATLSEILKERIAQLAQSEKETWANLNYITGAREELQGLLKGLENEITGSDELPVILRPIVLPETPEPPVITMKDLVLNGHE